MPAPPLLSGPAGSAPGPDPRVAPPRQPVTLPTGQRPRLPPGITVSDIQPLLCVAFQRRSGHPTHKKRQTVRVRSIDFARGVIEAGSTAGAAEAARRGAGHE